MLNRISRSKTEYLTMLEKVENCRQALNNGIDRFKFEELKKKRNREKESRAD